MEGFVDRNANFVDNFLILELIEINQCLLIDDICFILESS
jgi:hypothetical protein